MADRIFAKQLIFPRAERVKRIRDDETREVIQDVFKTIEDLHLSTVQQTEDSRFLTFGPTQSLLAAGQIDLETYDFNPVVGSGGAVVLVSNPQILAAVVDSGTTIIRYIKGTSNANTLTISDGNGVKLGASKRIMSLNDILAVYFDPITSLWHEISYVNLP